MKIRLSFSVLVIVACGVSVQAQDKPKVELFTGYSRAQFSSNDGLGGLNGWNISASVNTSKWLGLVADFSGHYRDDQITRPLATLDSNTRLRSALFGPAFYLRKHNLLTPFARVLIGTSTERSDRSILGLSFSSDNRVLGVAAGGGLDIKLTSMFALRPIQVERVFVIGERPDYTRIGAGVVFRFD